jgi:hypothetical protein
MSKASDAFTEMAADIERNPGKFGGAFVFFPPTQGGDPVGRLVVSKSDDASAAVFFWNAVQTELKVAMDKLQEKERQAQAFGGRR